MKKKIFKMLVLLVVCFSFAFSELPEKLKKGKKQINKTMTGQYGKIALTNLEMWFSNNGMNCENPITDSYGFMFPKGSDKNVVYRDGSVLAGMVNDSIKISCSMYFTDFQPGQSIQGVDPADPRYRIYMIRKDWKTLKDDEIFMSGPDYTKADYNRDYNEWPIDMGAPYELYGNGNKVPKFIGDEQAWYVMNDLNIDHYSNFYKYRYSPLGTEWQALVWAYDLPEALGNVIFKKYTIINKGNNNIENAYLSYWSDTDVGFAFNNYAGSDTILNLGYAYSSSDNDYFYGVASPAVGYAYLQGPTIKSTNLNDVANWNFCKKHGYKNLDMTSSNIFIMGYSSATYGDMLIPWLVGMDESDSLALTYYNLIRGYGKNGNPRINTLTREPSKFMFPGDPVTKTGWIWENRLYGLVDTNGSPIGALYPGWPGDVNITISSGPFTFAVGDTQEVVIGIVVRQGADRLSSITIMKNYTLMAQKAYNESIVSQQIITVNKPKETPSTYSLSQNYPNPFNPSTTIQYSIPKDEFVKLTVYDITGKVVKELVNGYKSAGKYSLEFNASSYSSGTYYYKLEAGEYKNIQKMVLIK